MEVPDALEEQTRFKYPSVLVLQKSQDVVGKLVSSPSDYPRAHICDECVSVCAAIIADDRPENGEPTVEETDPKDD
jgi:ATP-dependent protease Clp ATPase subunit